MNKLICFLLVVASVGSASIARAEKKDEKPQHQQTCTQKYDDCLGNRKWYEVFENFECSVEYAGCLKDKFRKAPDQPNNLHKVKNGSASGELSGRF